MVWISLILGVIILLFFHNVLGKLNNLIEIGKLVPIEKLMDCTTSDIEVPTILASNLKCGFSKSLRISEYEEQEERYVELETKDEAIIVNEEDYEKFKEKLRINDEVDIGYRKSPFSKDEIKEYVWDYEDLTIDVDDLIGIFYLCDNEDLFINFENSIPINNFSIKVSSISLLYINKKNERDYTTFYFHDNRGELTNQKQSREHISSINSWINNSIRSSKIGCLLLRHDIPSVDGVIVNFRGERWDNTTKYKSY
ncbi:hypothetical protein [Bacillus cereus]|uniref:hypothetical protein n=1 Tax=Bacillus cereus TaxID=1396 RepID=UPI000BF4273E|nr:hypothetical protein [Bacillus cereus]PFU24519.1 hypothetical protein COK76_15470 [Bacillus cereus]